MKTLKSLILAASVALAFGALHAKAQSYFPALPFTVTNQFEPLSFDMTVTMQALSTNTNVATAVSERITNPVLMKLLETAFQTNWPAGAKLALDLQYDTNDDFYNVYIVDKTGKIPIFNVTQGLYDETNDINVYFEYFPYSNPVITGKTNQKGKLTDVEITEVPIEFEFHVERGGLVTTDLYFYGLDVSYFKQTPADAVTQTDYAYIMGNGTFNALNAVITGQITGSGSWKPGAE